MADLSFTGNIGTEVSEDFRVSGPQVLITISVKINKMAAPTYMPGNKMSMAVRMSVANRSGVARRFQLPPISCKKSNVIKINKVGNF